ncbi:fungal-specific transcription factor domain-containing protein [Limtongia smithiae]|uniref:fungal-specific transcription factor domain-containing protein n=1 Tax=Limtongia smithiae TaxID=1125753 RepID=UPI0034D02082
MLPRTAPHSHLSPAAAAAASLHSTQSTLTRKMQACDRCHARKIKCDRRLPLCGPCMKAGLPCQHTDRVKQRTHPRGYIEKLEDRIKDLELLNASLQRQLQKAVAGNAHNGGMPSAGGAQSPTPEHSSHPTTTDEDNNIDDDNDDNNVDDELDDITTVASYLSLSAAGDTRYLGSASGVVFAQIVNATVTSAARRSSIVADTTKYPGMRSSTGLWVNPMIASHDANADAQSYQTPATAFLPRRQAADRLLEIYFSHSHIAFPFLSKMATLQAVDKIYSDPMFYHENVFWAFVFDLVLAIAASTVQKYDWNQLATPESHAARGLTKLNTVLCFNGRKPLIAILMLSVYALIHDTSASVWHLVGIAVRLCIELGLHREEVLVKGGYFEIEMRRRCFWCVFALDRMVSVTLGRPLALGDSEIDIPLPTAHTDECLWTATSNCDSFTSPAQCDCPSTSPFIHILGLRDVSGKILRGLYSKTPARLPAPEGPRIELARRLEAWKDGIAALDLHTAAATAVPLPAQLQQSQQQQRDGHAFQLISSFVDESWFKLLYHNCRMLLYRPSPVYPHPKPDTVFVILDSARESIRIYSGLHRSRRLNYSWLTLHAVFMAGLSYLYCIAKAMRWHRRPGAVSNMKQIPSSIVVINDTRACSNVLTAICERWNLSRDCQLIFDRLSGLIITELLDRSADNDFVSEEPPYTQKEEPRDQEMRGCLDDLRAVLSNDSFFAQSGVVMGLDQDWMEVFADVPPATAEIGESAYAQQSIFSSNDTDIFDAEPLQFSASAPNIDELLSSSVPTVWNLG